MTKKIALSQKTVALLEKIKKIKSQVDKISNIFGVDRTVETVELPKLADWLSKNEELVLSPEDQLGDEDPQFLLASLNAALMKDLSKSLPNYKKRKKKERDAGWANHVKYGLLIFAGTVFFGCEGFDGITAIVGILPLSTTALFIIGTLFAFISVMAFYAFNLTEIARNLDIEQKEARQLVDRYLKEVEEINAIYRNINNAIIKRKNIDEREEDLLIIELLIARYNALEEGRTALKKLTENKKLFVVKYCIALVIGVIYFSSGFFAGQAVATALAGLIVASTVPVFWPILGASFVVGLAAFSVYWFVERPSIDNLVGRWFGLEQEKIEQLCDSRQVENVKIKLDNLKEKLLLRNAKLAQESDKSHSNGEQLQLANKRIQELRRLLAKKQLQTGSIPADFQSQGFFAATTLPSLATTSKMLALRTKTLTLIEKLRSLGTHNEKLDEIYNSEHPESATLKQVINWLKQSYLANPAQNEDKEIQFILTSLNAALLKDLSKNLPVTKVKDKNSNQISKRKGLLYMVLATAGTIYFGCEGFDGITSIISLFSVPKAAVFVVGGFFAAISILAFYAFDLAEISKNLGIKKKNVNELVDIYLKEVNSINAIRRSLDSEYLKHTVVEELDEDLLITELLITRYKKLDESRASLSQLMASTKLTVLKYLVAGVIGIIYFSGGFFTGQAVVIAVASLFVASTASIFWPIFAASFAIGLAALAVYWFVERPSIEKLVGCLCGFDQEKIERLCDSERIEEHNNKLETLKTNIMTYRNERELFSLEQDNHAAELHQANKTISELEEKLGDPEFIERFSERSTASSCPYVERSKRFLSMDGFKAAVAEEKQQTLKLDSFFSEKRPRSKSLNDADALLSLSC